MKKEDSSSNAVTDTLNKGLSESDTSLSRFDNKKTATWEGWRKVLASHASAPLADFIGAALPLVLDIPYRQEPVCPPDNGIVLDCVTLIETLLAWRVALKQSPHATIDDFLKALRHIRYRQNGADNYTALLHYFSDWLRENAQRGFLRDITKTLGGKRRKKKLNWMSKHPQHYPQLTEHSHWAEILEREEHLSHHHFFYIPQERIAGIGNFLQQGDIIAFTSNKRGLDVAHCGFVLHSLHLLHASSLSGKVEIASRTMPAYVQQRLDVDGIIVARPL